MDYNFDVPFHGFRVRLYDERLSAFYIKRLTAGKVKVVEVNLLALYPRTSPFSCTYSVV